MRGEKHIFGSVTGRFQSLGASKHLLILWDVSKNPSTASDLVALAGTGDRTHGMAILDRFDKTNTLRLADGYNKTKIHARRVLDPHNWVLRLHDDKGRGDANFWSHRRVLDATNPNWTRVHRSTISMNACPSADWAFDTDLQVVVEVGGMRPALAHPELWFDGAGFLPLMTGKGAGKGSRASECLHVSKKGGVYTDISLAAQLWHVIHISLKGKGGGGGGGGPGQTVAENTLGDDPGESAGVIGVGVTQTAGGGKKHGGGGGCSVKPAFGTLRGDVEWDLDGRLAHLVVKGKWPKTKGRPLTGHMWIDEPDPTPPAKELAAPGFSNHPTLPRKTHEGLWIVVFDEYPWVPTPETPRVPPDFPDTPTPGSSTATPRVGEVGGYPVDIYDNDGTIRGVNFTVTIPEELPTGWGLNVAAYFVVPFEAGLLGTVGLRADYVVTALGGDAAPAARTGRLDREINSTTAPTGDSKRRVLFFIPWSDLKNAKGGQISLAFYRLIAAPDTQQDDFNSEGFKTQFGPQVTSGDASVETIR